MAVEIKNLTDLLKGHINGQVLDQTITRLTAPGENYGSLMLKVDIIVKNNGKEEKIHAVAKCLPPNKEMQAIFNIPVTFKNELAWYNVVIPTLKAFHREQGAKSNLDFFLDIYGARLSLDPNCDEVDDDAVILMENLALKGYVNANRREGFNLEQSKEILKKLATFHALSLALRIKKPEEFNEKVKKYLYQMKNTDDKLNAIQVVVEFLEKNPETSLLVPKVKESFKYLGPEPNLIVREPWAAAIHTDFWVNNMMLKEEKGKPPKVIILDLQTCAYGSPISDLIFFLGTSLQTHLLEKHFDELIELYYIELMENLKFLNVDTNLFPYRSFQKELELQGPSQFAHCMFFVGVIKAEKDKIGDSTKKDFKPEDELIRMFSNITDKHAEKYILLTKEFSNRNWI